MSFPRAKRFNYKSPEDELSPADYKRCPRFRDQPTTNSSFSNRLSLPLCSRGNCCRAIPPQTSTPQKERIIHEEQEEQNEQKLQCEQKERNERKEKERYVNHGESDHIPAASTKGSMEWDENRTHTIFSDSEEHDKIYITSMETPINDDSSESSIKLAKRLKKLRKRVKKMASEKICNKTKNHMLRMCKDVQNQILEIRVKIESMAKSKEERDEVIARSDLMLLQGRSAADKQFKYMMKDLIEATLTNLLDDLKMKYDFEPELLKLIEKIRAAKSEADRASKVAIARAASDLTHKLMGALNDHFEVSALSMTIPSDLEDEDELENINGIYFEVERPFKRISQQLRENEKELTALDRSTLEIKLRNRNGQQVLEKQSPILTMLKNEISAIKKNFTNNYN